MQLGRSFLELLLPRRCAACAAYRIDEPVSDSGGLEVVLCERCLRALPALPLSGECCALCQEGLPPLDELAEDARPRALCDSCSAQRSALSGCVAAVAFEGEVEGWIHRFKYPGPGLLDLDPEARTLVRSLAGWAARSSPFPKPEVVLPIPLHPRRGRARGFNPAAILAREVARAVAAPRRSGALVRIRDTPSQTGLDRRRRRENVAEAFACRPRLPRAVWLVDDVVTTGSTLAEAARCVKAAGAVSVFAICAARTRMR